jgi:hypothetical protein
VFLVEIGPGRRKVGSFRFKGEYFRLESKWEREDGKRTFGVGFRFKTEFGQDHNKTPVS